MNSSYVTKVQADRWGVTLRLWTDDERGQHMAVSEMRVAASVLATWWIQVRQAQDEYEQPPLDFDV